MFFSNIFFGGKTLPFFLVVVLFLLGALAATTWAS